MKKTLNRKMFSSVLAVLLIGAGFLFYSMGIHAKIAKATSLIFAPSNCYTASATSSPVYMTPGTATTTLECSMGYDGRREAVLAIQINASSTATRFDILIEESMDGQDWYPISMNQTASTTNPFSLTTRGTMTAKFASSTIGGNALGVSTNRLGVSGTDNRNHYSATIPVRMRQVRSVVTLAPYDAFPSQSTTSPSQNAAVWQQIIPKVEI